MGNDGGSIPKRRELVKEAARNPTSSELKETLQEQQAFQWTTCPLSHEPLIRPVVSDSSGRLYNKDAILEFLLPSVDEISVSKEDGEEVLQGRVKGLKDVVEVKFEVEEGSLSKDATSELKRERWVCPVTRKQLGSKVKSVYLVPCGHAFSDSAVKEIAGDSCLQCNESFSQENVIPILPLTSPEVEKLELRIAKLKEQGLTHSLKKASGAGKKRKKHGDTNDSSEALPSDPKKPQKSSNSLEGSAAPISSGKIQNEATAALTAKVLEFEKERNKRRKLGLNDNLKSLFSGKKDGESLNKTGDFMTRGYSIPSGAKR